MLAEVTKLTITFNNCSGANNLPNNVAGTWETPKLTYLTGQRSVRSS